MADRIFSLQPRGALTTGALSFEVWTELLGDAHLIQSDDVILNQGQVSGQINRGAGDDSYDGSHGVFKGALFGGLGDDTLIGSHGDDRLAGGGRADVFVYQTLPVYSAEEWQTPLLLDVDVDVDVDVDGAADAEVLIKGGHADFSGFVL